MIKYVLISHAHGDHDQGAALGLGMQHVRMCGKRL
jgi:glyoxylase-like metal-dependent hydrolase (beta-lactamase superfamily II)